MPITVQNISIMVVFLPLAMALAQSKNSLYYCEQSVSNDRLRCAPTRRHVIIRNLRLPRSNNLCRVQVSAIMFAERLPWQCHRNLIADSVNARSEKARHLVETGKLEEHLLNRVASIERGRVIDDKNEIL